MDQTSSDKAADIWTPHLRPGERLVWSADASPALRKADLDRARLIAGFTAGASAIIAVLLTARFLETIVPGSAPPYPGLNLGAAVAAPLYFAFALAMAALALWGIRRLNPKAPAATHFAATSQRLLALDAAGAVVDEMPAAEFHGVIAGGRRKTPDLYVLRKNDDKEERVFAIEHIEKPLEAKAVIEQTFMEHAS
jgi:hypothetical protein